MFATALLERISYTFIASILTLDNAETYGSGLSVSSKMVHLLFLMNVGRFYVQ